MITVAGVLVGLTIAMLLMSGMMADIKAGAEFVLAYLLLWVIRALLLIPLALYFLPAIIATRTRSRY
ncbi:hypothetical protein [Bradyrhizobium genosp. P]|uniref:hypothetical protein n=1 Tax=Bradyrhizobium genosp. P TaxID=83641 RepID=UPI003CFB275A